MNEKIYTIPVNEGFDAAVSDECSESCALCYLHNKLEEAEVDIILGASMMEPDIRIKTNKLGFCGEHFNAMYNSKNRLALALMLESHINEINKNVFDKGSFFSSKPDVKKQTQYLNELEESCYICSRINNTMEKYISTVYYLYRTEADFRDKFNAQKMFCLPHFNKLISSCRSELNKNDAQKFIDDINKIESDYIKTLSEDVNWFTKKFDYRNKDADWKNSKDAVPRAISSLSSKKV